MHHAAPGGAGCGRWCGKQPISCLAAGLLPDLAALRRWQLLPVLLASIFASDMLVPGPRGSSNAAGSGGSGKRGVVLVGRGGADSGGGMGGGSGSAGGSSREGTGGGGGTPMASAGDTYSLLLVAQSLALSLRAATERVRACACPRASGAASCCVGGNPSMQADMHAPASALTLPRY